MIARLCIGSLPMRLSDLLKNFLIILQGSCLLQWRIMSNTHEKPFSLNMCWTNTLATASICYIIDSTWTKCNHPNQRNVSMKKLLTVLALIPVIHLNVAYAKFIVCPTAKKANALFKNCKINVGKESCSAKFQGTDIVLNSPTEGLYGGNHAFTGFNKFKSIQILSHHFVCKYDLPRASRKMAWIIGSRHPLAKNCHLMNSKRIIGIPTCRSNHPNHCKIICS